MTERTADMGRTPPAIRSAMILAAGLGTRMRPLTLSVPKPLVEVAGRPLIDYGLENLRQAGVKSVVVNVHYLAEAIRAHLDHVPSPAITISDESERLLDSGGGIVKALAHFGGEPFFVLNADTFWLDAPKAPEGNLRRMMAMFDPDRMDVLMLLVEPGCATGHEGKGDFLMDAEGRLSRRRPEDIEEGLIYAGVLIVHPRLFEDAPQEPFSLNRLFDAAINADRMRGLSLAGHWITVGTINAIAKAEHAVAIYNSRKASSEAS